MKWLMKKLAGLLVTLVLISMLSFFAFSFIPGDAAVSALGVEADEAAVEALRKELGLDRPVWAQYAGWLVSALQGEFGDSLQYHMPVAQLVSNRLPVTVTLAVYAMLLVVCVSFPLGILGTGKPGGGLDTGITVLSQIGMAVPQFFIGILLTYVLGIVLNRFTVGGYVGYEENLRGFLKFLFIPAIAVAIPKGSTLIRYIRNSVVAEKRRDYVRTAKAKGNSEKNILLNHVLINVMLPVITMIAMMAADVLAGSIVVEQVFNIPGLGRLLITSIANRDFPVVQAIVLYIAGAVVVMNTLAEILYHKMDPRVK